MKALALVVLVVASVAVAATRARDANGSPPANCTDLKARGVSLNGVTTCRMSVRVDGGGNIDRGVLVPWYCNAADGGEVGPVELPASKQCVIAPPIDGGLRSAYLCDFSPGAEFGYVMVSGFNIQGRDAGSGAATLPDAGPASQPILRMECLAPGQP